MSFHETFQLMKKNVLNILFPIECISCGTEGKWLCDTCVKKIAYHNEFICPFCGHFSYHGSVCYLCKKHKNLDGVWIVGKYSGAMRRCIMLMKYNCVKDISDVLANFMVRFLENNIMSVNCDALIPVPLHKRKELWRGFNQSFLLAKRVSEHLHIFFDRKSLVRKKFTPSQTKRKREQRLRNIQGAFHVVDKKAIFGRRIMLIDDVITTGATLEECASALKDAGAISVWGFVLAKR